MNQKFHARQLAVAEGAKVRKRALFPPATVEHVTDVASLRHASPSNTTAFAKVLAQQRRKEGEQLLVDFYCLARSPSQHFVKPSSRAVVST